MTDCSKHTIHIDFYDNMSIVDEKGNHVAGIYPGISVQDLVTIVAKHKEGRL